MCLRISCAVMGPSHSLLAQPMSWEIDVAVENLKRKKNSFFTSLHLDWHLTETQGAFNPQNVNPTNISPSMFMKIN